MVIALIPILKKDLRIEPLFPFLTHIVYMR